MKRIWVWLSRVSGSSDRELLDALHAQLTVAHQATHLAQRVTSGDVSVEDGRREMTSVEHHGDHARAEVVGLLARLLATPLDREDVYRFSRALDDVVDGLRDFVREMDLFQVPPDGIMPELLNAISSSLEELHPAIQSLAHADTSGRSIALKAKKSAGDIRRRYQLGLANIYLDELSVSLLKRVDLLRRLDSIGTTLVEAADALADGAMKRGG